MSRGDVERLRTCLGGSEWAWLRTRLRNRLAQERPLPAVCRKRAPTPAEWEAAMALTGRPASPPGPMLSVCPLELESRLRRAGVCESLRDALEALDGPIPALATEARREGEAWTMRAAELRHRATAWRERLAERRPDLAELCAAMKAAMQSLDGGTLRTLCARSLSDADALIEKLSRVFAMLAELGAGYQPHRAHVAARALGSSHGLDANTLVYRAMALLAGEATGSPRDVWTAFSLANDEVSSSVLVLGLRFEPGGVADALNGFAAAGEPCRIMLRHALRLKPRLADDDTVYVCENPSIVETAAIELSTACQPLICTEGQPSLACQCLLAACAARTRRMCYHGDYDWGGLRIANFIWQVVPSIEPWRYNAANYASLSGGMPLTGVPVNACWDRELAPAMQRRAEAFHEEQVLLELLHDLTRSVTGAAGI